MKSKQLTRRQFIGRTIATGFAAPFLLPSHIWQARGGASPNEKIVMGVIGTGKQGRFLMRNFLGHPWVQMVAVSDVDTTRREHHRKMVDDFYSTKTGRPYRGCKAYPDFRDLLQRDDIDAVIIATPDHWHAYQVIFAANQKKDIYCEKPLSLTIREAKLMVEAVRRNQRVFQTGSMQRSMRSFYRACMLVRNGAIGEIKEIYISVGGPSRWCDLPTEPMEPGLNWDMWLGQAPLRPYNSVLSPRGVHDFFPNWRAYREYSGGGMTDWGAHHFDIAQWGLGMDHSGPVEVYPPDGKQFKYLTYRYANGVLMYHGRLEGYNYGVVFVGTKGKICVDRGRFHSEPEDLSKVDLSKLPIQLYHSTNHYHDFLQAVRKRSRPICDVEIGARSVTVCHLGNLVYWNKRMVRWDPQKWEFVKDPEANSWLDREKRDPWKLEPLLG